MKFLAITSTEALDAAVSTVVRRKIQHTELRAKYDAAIAVLEKEFQDRAGPMLEVMARAEADIQDYCAANRATLFVGKKSREISLAEFGFETTPPRVETSSKKVKWKDVLARLLRLPWGSAYVRQPEPQMDKQALLSDREKLSPEQCLAAGIQFCQDEQFFIRPKPETAQVVKEAR
jgi:phage host-nuclease inhibitor protein Gam